MLRAAQNVSRETLAAISLKMFHVEVKLWRSHNHWSQSAAPNPL
jgi:hypothetical protein